MGKEKSGWEKNKERKEERKGTGIKNKRGNMNAGREKKTII